MLQRIKKLLFIFPAIFLGILYPVLCSANWVETLKKGVGRYLLFLIVKLAVNIAKFFTELAGSLLNWVLSPNFISFSYTNPGGSNPNPIIKTGLDVTKGFVNMLLVLILVYIAIATILRLAGYETRKLLVTFIIVALLVNFASVICGLIVDASNIVMNFFIQDLKADAFGINMARRVEEISAGFEDRELDESGWSQIVQLAVMVPFLWVLTFILLLFTMLFIFRYLAIWLLVILSPIAFACYILPVTKKYFDQWWKQFINWSIIGITCGFFLYLGLLLVTYVPTNISKPSTGGNALFDGILPFFVSAAFLGIGFVFGLQTSAMGATAVINFAKTKGKATAKWTGKTGWRATRWTAEKTRAKMPERVRKWGERQMGARKWGEGEAGAKGLVKRAVATAVPLRYLRRGLGKTVGGGIVESEQRKIQETEKSIKDTDRTPTLLRRYHKSIDDAERIGIINKLIQKADIDDAMDEKKFGASAIKKDEMSRLAKKAKKLDSDKNLKQAFPHIAGEDDPAKIKDIISKMKPADYKNISKEALKDINVVDAMLSTAMGSHINQLVEQHGRVAAEAIENGIASHGTNLQTRKAWLAHHNPRLSNYLGSYAGQGLISIPEGPTSAQPSTPPPPERQLGRGPAGRRAGGKTPKGRRP